jgi:hypothetical protein
MSDKPVGQPYSQVYVERGVPLEDSERFRLRLRGYLRDLSDYQLRQISTVISKETGAGVYVTNVAQHITECPLVDLLDNVTHAFDALIGTQGPNDRRPHFDWLEFVARSLSEENLAYVVDGKGGVHPAHDQEFDASRRATIAALGLPRYSTARQFFDHGIADLKPPQDTRDAVRKVFEAVENVAKLMDPKLARLGATEVDKSIRPAAIKYLTGAERDATSQMINGFSDWVIACQPYRHAPGTQEPEPPSVDLAIWIVSTGASQLRWLISLDQKLLTS